MSTHRRRRVEQRSLRRLQGWGQGVAYDADTATASMVRRATERLPKDLRAVVVLRFYADLSVADTAAALGLPEGTVKSRTRQALAQLRDSGLIATSEVTDAF